MTEQLIQLLNSKLNQYAWRQQQIINLLERHKPYCDECRELLTRIEDIIIDDS